MRGLFIGRFQPLHLGHVSIIEAALDEVDELIIGIGSAESSYTPKDPFTAGERMEMLLGYAKERGWGGRLLPVPVRDVNRYSIWVDHVVSLLPRFEKVFSNNPLTSRLFSDAGFEVCSTRIIDREHFSGTAIRELMMNNGEWQSYVPVSTSRLIKVSGWMDRLNDITNGDR
ncbi:MAG: nicotinamide-nucleotide adenylyltransferase [Candidatus Thermoplasmatota archaeon]|nr:nicotinamide-nucleotide adenylyltransferase [Candidatus Thermoplasmatota archaeon]